MTKDVDKSNNLAQQVYPVHLGYEIISGKSDKEIIEDYLKNLESIGIKGDAQKPWLPIITSRLGNLRSLIDDINRGMSLEDVQTKYSERFPYYPETVNDMYTARFKDATVNSANNIAIRSLIPGFAWNSLVYGDKYPGLGIETARWFDDWVDTLQLPAFLNGLYHQFRGLPYSPSKLTSGLARTQPYLNAAIAAGSLYSAVDPNARAVRDAESVNFAKDLGAIKSFPLKLGLNYYRNAAPVVRDMAAIYMATKGGPAGTAYASQMYTGAAVNNMADYAANVVKDIAHNVEAESKLPKDPLERRAYLSTLKHFGAPSTLFGIPTKLGFVAHEPGAFRRLIDTNIYDWDKKRFVFPTAYAGGASDVSHDAYNDLIQNAVNKVGTPEWNEVYNKTLSELKDKQQKRQQEAHEVISEAPKIFNQNVNYGIW